MRRQLLLWTFSVCFLSVTFVHAQSQTTRPSPPTGGIDSGTATGEPEDARARLARGMAKKANTERQAALKADTDKLLKLAGELKDYVDKSNENMLSIDVMKKAEEIEKLARSVRDKMKGPN